MEVEESPRLFATGKKRSFFQEGLDLKKGFLPSFLEASKKHLSLEIKEGRREFGMQAINCTGEKMRGREKTLLVYPTILKKRFSSLQKEEGP